MKANRDTKVKNKEYKSEKEKEKNKMALQRFKEVFLVAVILACTNTAGVNSVELNSTNFASSTEVTTKDDILHAETENTASLAPKLSLSETSETKANLTEARITSITFRSEEADVDKENDETISFGIRSFTVEIATPATEKPIPLNEKVSAASKINVQQASSSLPILTLENDQVRNDKVSNERAKVFETPVDTLTPKATVQAKNKHENIASTVATQIDTRVERPVIGPQSDDINTFDEKHLQSAGSIAPVNSEHEPLSISSNGMHVEQKLENGLYRIKIAEIITDEFNNGKVNGDTKQVPVKIEVNNQKYDKNDDFMHASPPLSPVASSHPSGQINIDDLYPSKLEDFSSIIRESNEKLIEEKNRYVGLEKSGDQPTISDSRFNLIDDGNEQENSIQFGSDGDTNFDRQKQLANGAFNSIENNIPTTKIEIELIDEPVASKDDVKIIGPGDDDDYVSPAERANGPNNDKVTDFTSELQLKDDMVSKIEQSFRESSMTNIEQQQQQLQKQQPITINHALNPMGFIERRVKKFDPTFKKRLMQNDGNTNADSKLGAIAATSKTKSIDENIILHSDDERKIDANIPDAKFYRNKGEKSDETTVNPNKTIANKQTNNDANSSKSRMSNRNNKSDDIVERTQSENILAHGISSAKKDPILSTRQPINAPERKILFINVNSSTNKTIDKNELERLQKDREQIIKESHLNTNADAYKVNDSHATATPSTNMHLYIIHDDSIGQKPSESIKTNYNNANKPTMITPSASSIALTTAPTVTSSPETHPSESAVILNQTTSKEPSAVPALIDTISSTESNSDKHSSSQNLIKSITQSSVPTTIMPSTTTMQTKSRTMNTNYTPKQKPFGRRGYDGFYFETECDMQTPLPSDSTIWRGNETHELNLPTTVSQILSSFSTLETI